jgi:hypothetical protein
MYASLLLGLGSHKEGSTSALLQFYYWKPVLFLVCAFTELWYVTLYTLAFNKGPSVMGHPLGHLVLVACTPFFAFKQVCNFVQFGVAAEALCEHDMRKKRSK